MGIVVFDSTKKEEVNFPKGKIVLLDGRTIDCYPSANEEELDVVDESLELDATGQYFSIGRKRCNPIPSDPEEKKIQKELFIYNAFYLLAHKERILSDSRMFLCPVAIQNGLAYTGTSGFKRPTLGVYLEWWASSPHAMSTDKKGCKQLVYHIAGSPLSGGNKCAAVREDGKRLTVTLSPFIEHWRPFMAINGRYNEAKYIYQAYSLQQVLNILRQEDEGNMDYSHTIETAFMTHEIYELNRFLENVKKQRDVWQAKYEETLAKYKTTLLLRPTTWSMKK